MKKLKSFLHINRNLDQININSYNMISGILSQTSLSVVDFERIQRLRDMDHQAVTREYMLLKMGMFDMWEVLYRYDQ